MFCLVWLLESCFVCSGYWNHILFGAVIGIMFCLVWLLESCFVWCGYWNHVLFVVVTRTMLSLVFSWNYVLFYGLY